MEEQVIRQSFPMGKPEKRYGLALLLINLFLWDCIGYGGLNLGFALGSLGVLGCTAWYFRASGIRFGWYSGSLLILACVIAAGFARSADEEMKFYMVLALILSASLSFLLAAGQNRRDPGSLGTLLDGFRGVFPLGFGSMAGAARGVLAGGKTASGKQKGATALGLALALPLAAVLVSLLSRADAAFEAVVGSLPSIRWSEPAWVIPFGVFFAWMFYGHGVGLRHREKPVPAPEKPASLSPLTVNILLGAACLVYGVFLFSQLAYLGGGFAGVLPEGFTAAEYARRGFFELAWLGAVNLALQLLAARAGDRKTAWLGLALGVVTVLLAAASGAKMVLYVTRFGLTRKRLLTQAVMVFLAGAAGLVSVRLLKPRFGYMRFCLLLGLILGALLFWGDVDGMVASYNVRAYQSGHLETVDLNHLSRLGAGSAPALERLALDEDPELAQWAMERLSRRGFSYPDIRGWNAAEARLERAGERLRVN